MSNYSILLEMLYRSNESESFYAKMGSTPVLEYVFMCGIGPAAVVGFALNLVALIVLHRRRDDQPVSFLHNYLRVYVLNSAIVCAIVGFTFTGISPRLYPWFYHWTSRVHRCVLLPLGTMSFLTVNRALEILLICQRLANFNAAFQRVERVNWTRAYALLLVASVLLNVPFVRVVKSDAQLYEDLSAFTSHAVFTYCANDFFYNTAWINYTKMVVTFVREFVTLCVELALSVALNVYFRRFLVAKSQLMRLKRQEQQQQQQLQQQEQARKLTVAANLRRLTRVVAQFSIFSAVSNIVRLVVFIILALTYNNILISQCLVLIEFGVIVRPFITIFLLGKIDKNVKVAFA